jgi:hypothetical protein
VQKHFLILERIHGELAWEHEATKLQSQSASYVHQAAGDALPYFNEPTPRARANASDLTLGNHFFQPSGLQFD